MERNAEATDILKQTEAKKKLLVEYTKPKREKELQAAVEKARAEELAKQAEWEFAKARVERVRKMSQRQTPGIDKKRILALIERAIPIEEQVYGKLAQLAKAEKSNDLLHKEIQDLTNELRAILDEGEALWSAGELARLKPRIEVIALPAIPAIEK